MAVYSRKNMIRGGSLILRDKRRKCQEVAFCKSLNKSEIFEVCGVKDVDTDIFIFCCYQNGKYFEQFIEKLELLLQRFIDKHCIICGDFNVNILTENSKKRDFMTVLASYNFRHLVNQATFKRNGVESCLDNILTNIPENNIARVEVDENGLSDGHAAISCSVRVDESKNTREEIIIKEQRSYTQKNMINFRQNFIKVEWETLGLNGFLKKFDSIFKSSFRKTRKKVNLTKLSKINWISKGIKVSSKMKRFLSSANGVHNHASIIKYKENYIRIYRRVINEAKKKNTQRDIKKAKNSIKGIWSVVDKCDSVNKAHKSTHDRIILKLNNKIISHPLKVAEIFADHFRHNEENEKYDVSPALSLLSESTNKVVNTVNYRPVTPSELEKIVCNMENKTSYGCDEVPVKVIKDNIDLLKRPLSYLFNLCFENSVFPDQFKIARILPLHKKNDKCDPKNYRPISLLPVLSKLLEKLIKVRLMTHLNSCNVLTDRQFGYRKGVGTKEAIQTLVSDILMKINEKQKVSGIFLDLSSAFDLVDHSILIAKLEYYGVTKCNLQLVKSYFSNRFQYVELRTISDKNRVEITTSKLVSVGRGVPQGSVLGPIFFLIYINDLVNYMKLRIPDINLTLFADDTTAIVASNDINNLSDIVNTALTYFDIWFTTNNLKINSDKTNIILFKNTSRDKDYLDIKLKGESKSTVTSIKSLGVYINEYLNWKDELMEIDKKVSSACYALRKLRQVLTMDQLKGVYYALVESRFRYSIQLWGMSYDYNTKKAFSLQKRAVRAMVRIPPWESCREHFINLGILTIPSLYILIILTDFVNTRTQYETVSEKEARENTRRKDFPTLITPRLNVVRHGILHQVTRFYNKLPVELKVENRQHIFKTKLKLFLVKKCFYTINEFFECNANDMNDS